MQFQSSRHILLVCAASLFFLPLTLVAQQPVSHVRVVRLSYVSGTVAVKRAGATEWTKALVNTPVQEGFEISTSADSFVEVEFENDSTARLGELSHLAFDQLALDATGAKLNRMTFEQGYATFHFLPVNHDVYSVRIADATLTPSGHTLFRTDLAKGHVRVEVFNGSVQIVAPSGSTKLGKDKILEYNTGTTEVAFNTRQGTVKDSWDKWTEARDSQANLALNDQAVGARGPLYGWSDLDAYGEWAMYPGFGYGWAPFAPMGWAPYSMGMWNWYSGMGYTWISGEPWGWLPYHYGNWNFSPDFGWFWMPGNFGYWSPALVSWYSGPGWVGWAPLGLTPRPGLMPVTTVSGTAIRTGQIITPQGVGHARFDQGTLKERLPFEPGAGATLTGNPFAAGAGTSFSAHAGGANTPAPPSILMGGEGDKESALRGGRRLFHEPLRARLGTTLGGRYAVGGAVGEFRGDAFKGIGRIGGVNGLTSASSHGNSQPGLSVLPHGQSAESSGFGGGGMMHAAGGGGFPSCASHAVSAPSASQGASSSAGGGHH